MIIFLELEELIFIDIISDFERVEKLLKQRAFIAHEAKFIKLELKANLRYADILLSIDCT